MFKSASPLPESARVTICASLNERVADAIDLYNAAKVAHWNVKGPQFAQLHALFESLASMLSEHADKIAERAVALGGVAQGTSEQVLKASSIDAYPESLANGSDHVRELFARLTEYNAGLHESIGIADEASDVNTVTLLSDISLAVEKMAWQFAAHLEA